MFIAQLRIKNTLKPNEVQLVWNKGSFELDQLEVSYCTTEKGFDAHEQPTQTQKPGQALGQFSTSKRTISVNVSMSCISSILFPDDLNAS